TKVNDYAAAIFHYQRHLELATNSPHAQLVRDRIRGCKLELASTEFPLPNSQTLQQQVFALTEENRLLKQQLEEVRNRAGANPAPGRAPHPTGRAHPVVVRSQGPPIAQAVTNSSVPMGPAKTLTSALSVAAAADAQHPRTYVVQAGDSIYGTAKRYGLK